MSAKRENGLEELSKDCAPSARCRRDARQVTIWERGRPARKMSAKRENGLEELSKDCAPSARCGRDARGPRRSLERIRQLVRLRSLEQSRSEAGPNSRCLRATRLA